MATNQDIAKTIAMLQAAYSNFTPNAFTPEIYMQLLGDLPGNLLQAAVYQILAEPRQFAPAPGEIRAAAANIKARAEGIPSAAAAYAEVCEMPANMQKSKIVLEDGQNVIITYRLSWSHEFVGIVAKLIGWPRTFPSPDNPTADRAQFMRIYDSEVARLLQSKNDLPAVRAYIETEQSKQLTAKAVKALKG